jgi:hypothetical protein
MAFQQNDVQQKWRMETSFRLNDIQQNDHHQNDIQQNDHHQNDIQQSDILKWLRTMTFCVTLNINVNFCVGATLEMRTVLYGIHLLIDKVETYDRVFI